VFVSIPMDDWDTEVDDARVAFNTGRRVVGRAVADPEEVRALAERLNSATNPVLAVGPEVDAGGGWDAAIALADRQRLPVWAIPAPGGGRIGFPEDHAHFQGILPPAIGPLSEVLKGHDLILVVGSSVFPYYPNIPGPLLPEGASLVAITNDPDEAARAPMGDAIVADPKLTLEALVEAAGDSDREPPPQRPAAEPAPESDPMSSSTAVAALAEVFPEDGIVVLESPSATLALRNQIRLSRPGSYYFGAGGGLGFGLAASIGVQLAQPDRPVVCIVGEGSAQYAITAFWTAAAYKVPVTFLVLRNEEYAILKWFAEIESVANAPGLDLPKLDTASVAAGYGVESQREDDAEGLKGALQEALGANEPRLVETRVAAGMALA
jgi:benzoylformate decarboxylase